MLKFFFMQAKLFKWEMNGQEDKTRYDKFYLTVCSILTV